ncbi:putative GPR1 FUN34 yaaH family [Trypanosoma vivax]|nr:putative GPR1/FUN34/yaaH family [Trypanosoma vivax]KAH8607964.1 putative GPR1 FUN34 yaaH family [Trypanosoma vivax]
MADVVQEEGWVAPSSKVEPLEVENPPEPASVKCEKKLADPGPLGLLAFGMTTIMFCICKAGICKLNTTIGGMGLIYGGVVQMIVGIIECFRGNTLGLAVLTTYGAFWVSTVCSWMMVGVPVIHDGVQLPEAEEGFLGAYFLLWTVFTYAILLAVLHEPLVIVLVFFLLGATFLLLSLSCFLGVAAIGKVAGYCGIVCGCGAMYSGLALLLKESRGYTVLPLFPHRGWKITGK